MSFLKKIEQSVLGHFQYLPEKLDGNLSHYNDVILINSRFNTSMFNICFGALTGDKTNWEKDLHTIAQRFNGQPFAWWVPASATNPAFSEFLTEMGLVAETKEYAMLCAIDALEVAPLKTDVTISQVTTKDTREDFIRILEPYDKHVRAFYEALSLDDLTGREQLFVGLKAGKPVVIGVLYEEEDTAAIFTLMTDEAHRGCGYGGDMMNYLLSVAKQHQKQYLALLASSDAGYRLYQRLGFKECGLFECFEYDDCVE